MSSETIYTSEKILPYVYICIHKTTEEFYIGYRSANKVPSSEDLGKVYFTSSKRVKPIFEEFNFYIIAEFFDSNDAYNHEQTLIKDHFNDALCINQHYISPDNFYGKFNPGTTKISREKAKSRMLSEHNPCYNQSKETKNKLSSIVSLRNSKLTSDEKKLKYGNYAETNGFYKKKHSEDTILILREKNTRYEYKLISPSGEIFTTLSLKNFCNEHNLNRQSLNRFMNKGKVPPARIDAKEQRINTSGWEVCILNETPTRHAR
jgi:hypothetical protein